MRMMTLWLLLVRLAAARTPTPEEVDQLVYSAWFGKLPELRRLLEQGIDPNVRDGQEQTPLEMAAGSRQPEAVRWLLKFGADPNLPGRSGQSVLSGACWDGETEIARMLLVAGARPSPCEYFSPLYTAVLSGNLDTVKLLLKWEARPNPAQADFEPPTVPAAHNFPEALQLLLAAGADPNRAQGGWNKEDNYRPFTRAVYSGNLASVKVLLAYKVDPDQPHKAELPIELAARQGHRALVQLLLPLTRHPGRALVAICRSGWLPEARTLMGRRFDTGVWAQALTAAADGGQDEKAEELCRLLLEHTSASPEALLAAARRGHLRVSRLLLDSGVSLETRSAMGETPLLLATRAGAVELVAELLKRGADPKAVDANGRDALQRMLVWAAGLKHRIETLQRSRAIRSEEAVCRRELARYQEAMVKIAELLGQPDRTKL